MLKQFVDEQSALFNETIDMFTMMEGVAKVIAT
jgi:hypothetical protein